MKQKKVAIDCPSCGKKAELLEMIKKIPHFGNLLLSTLLCKNCGFKFSDVMPAEFHKPRAFSAKIERQGDLRTKIIRSSSGTVSLKGLGITISPQAMAEGYISNIEGLLDRVESAIKAIAKSNPKAKEKLQELQKAKNGKILFTVEILDPFGNSALLGKKVKEKKLSKAQIKKLKTGFTVI